MQLDNRSIVVLDGHCLNPGDLSWGGLEALGRCTVYERTLPEQLGERIGDADVVLTNKVPLRRELLSGQSRLHEGPRSRRSSWRPTCNVGRRSVI